MSDYRNLLALRRALERNPEQRFGQFLSNFVDTFNRTGYDIFYASDQEVRDMLEEM